MAKIDIPGLRPKKTAGGLRYYWEPSATLKKAGWPSKALGRDPLDAHRQAEAINKQIEEWRSGGAKPRHVRAIVKKSTVAALIEKYQASRAYTGLKDTTQREYKSKLKTINAWAGSEPVIAITKKNVRTLRDALMEPDADGQVRHNMAHATLRVLRTLLKFAVDEEIIPENPAESFGLAKPEARQTVAGPEARAALEQAAIDAGEPNFALSMMLACATGQRQADLLKLQHSQFVEVPAYKLDPEVHAALAAMAPDGRVMAIRIRQGKGRVWIEVPVIGPVREAIEREIKAARAIGATTLLYDENDRTPWTSGKLNERLARQTAFQRRFGDHREAAAAAAATVGDEVLAAELRGVQFRDYRRTCVVILGELGLADHLISAITGHSLNQTKEILEVYMPRTTGMAARAIMLSAERDNRQAKREQQA